MVQNSNTVNNVKALRYERELEDIGLEYRRLAAHKVTRSNFRRQAQINSHYMCPPASCHVGESSHATSHIQHQLADKISGMETGTTPESTFRAVIFRGVQLRPSMHVPLETKTPGVLLLIDEAHNSVHQGILSAADTTEQAALPWRKPALAA